MNRCQWECRWTDARRAAQGQFLAPMFVDAEFAVAFRVLMMRRMRLPRELNTTPNLRRLHANRGIVRPVP